MHAEPVRAANISLRQPNSAAEDVHLSKSFGSNSFPQPAQSRWIVSDASRGRDIGTYGRVAASLGLSASTLARFSGVGVLALPRVMMVLMRSRSVAVSEGTRSSGVRWKMGGRPGTAVEDRVSVGEEVHGELGVGVSGVGRANPVPKRMFQRLTGVDSAGWRTSVARGATARGTR